MADVAESHQRVIDSNLFFFFNTQLKAKRLTPLKYFIGKH